MLSFYEIQTERFILPGDLTVYLTQKQIQIRVNVCADNDVCEQGAWYRVSAYRHNNLHFAIGEVIGLSEPLPSYLASALVPFRTSSDEIHLTPSGPTQSNASQSFKLFPLHQILLLSPLDFAKCTGLTPSAFDNWIQRLKAFEASRSSRGRPPRFTLEQRLSLTLLYYQHPTLKAAALAHAYGVTESRMCQIIRAMTKALKTLGWMLSDARSSL